MTGNLGRGIFLLALAGLAAGAAAEPEPLVTDRPDFTESTVAVSPGRFQFEMGATWWKVDDERAADYGELLVRIGAFRDFEFRVGLGAYVRQEDAAGNVEDGWTNTALGLKWRFVEPAGAVPELALLAAAVLPTGSRAVASEEVDPSAILAAAWELSPTVGLGSNLGVIRSGDAGDRYTQAWLTLACGIGLGERWGLFVEAFGFSREERNRSTGYGDAGVTFLAGPDLQFDARIGLGFNGRGDDWFAGLGLVFRI